MDIQSVLDVRDDNPLPKGAGPGLSFNRSILILTPQRALKFTAMSQERHYVWLTALSFLSHSPFGLGDLTALPNIPPPEPASTTGSAPSLRRNPIRDSIRVAKGRGPQARRGDQRSFTTDGVMSHHGGGEAQYLDFAEAAEPPTIPRYHGHSRQRSNTAPRPPPASYRNPSYQTSVSRPPKSTYSMTTSTGPEMYNTSMPHGHYQGGGGSGFDSIRSSSSRRGSEASASGANTGYPDSHAAPTMRMEAFIGQQGAQKQKPTLRARHGRKRDMGYLEGVGEQAFSPGEKLHRTRSRSPTDPGNHIGQMISRLDGGRSIRSEDRDGDRDGFDGMRRAMMADYASASAEGYPNGAVGVNQHFRDF